MVKYQLSFKQPERHFIQIKILFDNIHSDRTEVCLPLWRPGRYEIQNYPKNINKWQAYAVDGSKLHFSKTSKGSWVIDTSGIEAFYIEYTYYANQLDAGASYIDGQQIYVNPCNCLMYIQSRMEENCMLELSIPESYTTAISLCKKSPNVYEAANFHELADSPFIASSSLNKCSFKLDGAEIYIWFQGNFEYNQSQLIEDFTKFCKAQKEFFGELPLQEYHFLFQMMPYPFHHGVEHSYNTVIAMGPDKNFERRTFYTEFLGISCHEFFHLWNVKRIRPVDMHPYKYQEENYSTLGWVYEGVTTYYGDLLCLRSGVFSFDEWAAAFGKYLQKHFDNEGRYHLSVAASSFDTWLDGYVAGIPNRKVSIYTEGMLAAFILDAYIRKQSQEAYCLDDVMRGLYHEFYKLGKGFTQSDYQMLATRYAGKNLDWYFNEVINSTGYIEKYLADACHWFGLEIIQEKNADILASELGIKSITDDEIMHIIAIHSGSPAEEAGIDLNESIISINGRSVSEFLNTHEKAIQYVLNLKSPFNIRQLTIKPKTENYFSIYRVVAKAGQEIKII